MKIAGDALFPGSDCDARKRASEQRGGSTAVSLQKVLLAAG